MAKKKKTEKPQREYTRRQLSHWQQQKKRQRIIITAGFSLFAVVILILLAGWYTSLLRPLYQTAIIVNETEFNMKYYIEALKTSGQDQPAEYMQYIAENVKNNIEQNELIKQGAMKLGISVSDDEVKQELKKSGLPGNDAYKDLARSQLILEKLRTEHFESEVPQSAEQTKIMVILLESEIQANEVRARLENGEIFTELAGELSLDYSSKENDGDLGWHTKNILVDLQGTSIPAEYAFSAEAGALSEPLNDEEIQKAVGYWLIKVLERKEEDNTLNAQAMLLSSEDEAQNVRARLEAGEDFATLAREFSNLPGVEENEGNYDDLAREMMTSAFDEFAFNSDIEPGTLSEPIRDETVSTKGGYWLVKVIDKADNRAIDDIDKNIMTSKAMDEWVISLWDDPKNEVNDSFLNNERIAWAIQQAIKN